MKLLRFLFRFAAIGLCAGAVLPAQSEWEHSLVSIEVTSKVYDAFQPWNDPTRAVRKHGLVIGPGEVLTTAQNLPTHTLVRLQKGGRGRWYDARVTWWDAQSNLALLTADSPAFWEGLQAASLAEAVSRGPDFELIRWRDGNLEERRVEFGQFTVGEGVLGFAPHVQMEVAADLSGLGWAEPIMREGRVLGLTTHSNGRVCGVLPAAFIRRVLAAHRAGTFTGLGYFDFTWQAGGNPELLKELGLEGPSRGGVVNRAGHVTDPEKAPQPRDIILAVDGFEVDSEGDYLDPDFGHLVLENLANRAHFAGDTVKLRLRRGAEERTIDYVVPKARFTDELVPREVFGTPPVYLVTGGLVFQPLTQPFLRGWGDEWRKYAPFRLQYYQYADAHDHRDSLVVLTGVLPDAINLGYQDADLSVLDRVNGRSIATLTDLAEALKTASPEGVHRFEFMRGHNLQRLLLDAATLDEATRRVVEHYGLPAAARF
ncbi:hypothetical protein EBZ70_03980 [bacterium]|nr:hypothetical protein [bacterium]